MEKEREMKGTYWPRATEGGLRQASGRKKNGKGQENDQPEPQWKIHLGRRSVRSPKVVAASEGSKQSARFGTPGRL